MSDQLSTKFNTIKNFVTELSVFFDKNMCLKLYSHLLSRTTTNKHPEPVKKHVKIFTDFVKGNRDEIISPNVALTKPCVQYSERVKIDFAAIFKMVEEEDTCAETQAVIFEHLLVLSTVLDPESGAGDLMKKKIKEKESDPTACMEQLFEENPFLSDMMEKVESHVRPGANPMEAMTSMMSSGILQDLVGGMQKNIESGDLDIEKLMGSVQKMTASLPPDQLGALGPMMNQMMSNPAMMPQQHVHPVEESKMITARESTKRGGKKKRKKKKKNR